MCTKAGLLCFAIFASAELFALPKTMGIFGGGDEGANVENSTIRTETTNSQIRASDGSNVNTGVSAKGAQIENSEVKSNFTGNINVIGSTVNTGVKVDGATITDSSVSSTTSGGSINAYNSSINTGTRLSGAEGSNISSNVSYGGISAENSTVNIGSITGSAQGKDVSTNVGIAGVKARNETINIGNVNLNSGGGGRSSSDLSFERKKSGTSIANVNVEDDDVDEVNVTVGDAGKLSDKIKTRHKAKVYEENDGVDASGTKSVFINKKERREAEKEGSGVGNVNIEKGSDVKKVNVYSE